MENSSVLQEDDLVRLHAYLGRNVYERLYNTPTTSSKMGRSPTSNARAQPTGEVLIIPASKSTPEKLTSTDSGLQHSFHTPKDSVRGNSFHSRSTRKSVDSDPDLTELIREKKCALLDQRHEQKQCMPSHENARRKQSFSPAKVQKVQWAPCLQTIPQDFRSAKNKQISPDSVVAFSAALTPRTDSPQKGNVVNILNENRAESASAVKRQLFTSETPTRSNRSLRMSSDTPRQLLQKPGRPSRVTPNRLLQKMAPLANERLVIEQAKARNEISAAAKKGLDKFFQNIGDEGISFDEMNKLIKELYPELDYKALALLAYESLRSNREGLVNAAEFQQFVHFLAFFNGVWKDVVYWDKKFGLSVRRKDFVAVSRKLGLFDNPLATFSELDSEGRGRILYDRFCTLCVSKKIQTKKNKTANEKPNISNSEPEAADREETSDKKEISEDGRSSDFSLIQTTVNSIPLQEILNMFDSDYVPTWETASELFCRIDVHQTGKLNLSDIMRGLESLYVTPASKPLALRVYAASEFGEKECFDRAGFYQFLLFLIYFNNLWDYFGFSRRKHLRVSKRRFIPAATNLGLFDSPEVDFEQMDKTGQGYVSFEDFCMACARRRLEQSAPLTGSIQSKINIY